MTIEQNRSYARKQYFELRNELNRANKIRNLKTELEFIIRENEEESFIIIKSSGANHGMRLASRFKNEPLWFVYTNLQYEHFYKYMYKKISQLNSEDQIKINVILTSWLLRLWMV